MVNNRVGSPVRGDDFFGRDAFVDIVRRKLDTGHHVLLAAPRRFGKTSVMYRLMDAPSPDHRHIHIDLEYHREPAGLLTELVERLARSDSNRSLKDRLSRGIRQFWNGFQDSVDEVGISQVKIKLKQRLQKGWQAEGEELFRALAALPGTTVLILDELPMMIDGMIRDGKREEAITLLRWLRAIRHQPDIPNLRFLVAGSIGIERLLNELGEISAINDFEKLRLEPFAVQTARPFIDELAQGEELTLSGPSKKKLLDLIGTPVPYFIQILFSEISKLHALEGKPIGPKTIEAIYQDKVLGVDCKSYFEHYHTRLRDYYRRHEEQAAKRILKELAMNDALSRDICYQIYRRASGREAHPDQFNMLMADLENDFYIRFEGSDERYRFSCKLLRDWWLRYHSLEDIV